MAAAHAQEEISVSNRRPHTLHTMRVQAAILFAAALACILSNVKGCRPDQAQSGCKIYGTTCTCGYGCQTEYIYKSRPECENALRERSSNSCYRLPCVRGICIQTMQDPGFTCKCEGTGFYGQRCERACPSIPMRGLVFPHECIVI